MDPFHDPPPDSLAAARLHVQALTECGLSREALLRALLENYEDGEAPPAVTLEAGSPQQAAQQGQQPAHQGKMPSHGSFNTRLSISTTSSHSSGRASVMSTATSMSSVSSPGGLGTGAPEIAAPPPLPPPPAPPIKSNNRGSSKPRGTYWCTFCDVDFQRKFDWKRHEDEFHERYKRYPCPNCNRIFWGANTFNQHHKNAHGCTTCPHADRVVKYTQKKTAWACGFCGGFLASRDRYFDHVARHYEDGCNKSHWNHSLVIYGLLHQPSISQAWKELDAELYGHLPRNQQPLFEWDHDLTGHAQGFLEGENPGKLQDLLEFFNEGRDDPKLLARLAHESATIRLRNEVRPTATPIPSAASPNARPTSELPKQNKVLKSLPSTKHTSTPQATRGPSPSYDDGPLLKRQRSLALIPDTFPKNNPFFSQSQQHSQPHTPQEAIAAFPQPMMGTATGGFYDLTATHVHPHMQTLMSQMTPQQQQQLHEQEQQQLQQPQQQQQSQQQQQVQNLMVPLNIYDDWSSMAGTVVDDSMFTSAMAMWQPPDLGRGHAGSSG
ncbi:hypothetical protein N657DRAFT_684559 [Parathielavia appendiculata]|uniref:C2H2-type domain-containing protein n=1 Tax=Parathielavia appendiculata TaxID=2587402 RepID=A0AAN6TRG2_9PEZI|nr:hypothetical protein N657DRAFT_684559 [Parathielavia appendiculata]